MKLAKLMIFMIFSVGSVQAYAEKTDLKLTGKQGVHFFFTLSKPWAADKKYIRNLSENFCADKPVCFTHIYLTGTAAPKGFPLSDSEVAAEIATYNRNKNTGAERMLWSCSRFPDEPSSTCFSD